MAHPHYVVGLKGKQINGSRYSGEGSQIAALIGAVAPFLGDCVWYVSDVEQTDGPEYLREGVKQPARIGTTNETMQWLPKVAQFVWGMFLAVPTDRLPVTWGDVSSETEPFPDIGEAVLAINSFDSSDLYIYAIDITPLQPLVERYDGVIRTSSDPPWRDRI